MNNDNNKKNAVTPSDGGHLPDKRRNEPKPGATKKIIFGRCRFALGIVIFAFAFLIFRLAMLQLVDAEGYKKSAIDQYTTEITVSAKRGTIYDRNLTELAVGATVENVFISPSDIEPENAMKIAQELSEILGVDKDEIYKKYSDGKAKQSRYVVIKKNVEEKEANLVRELIDKNNYVFEINIEEGTKRYYPYGSLASHILGFSGSDNTGLVGIEAKYNSELSGIDGRVIRGRDGKGNDLPFKYETYIDAQDGYNLVTTLDYTVQGILEKYLLEAFEDNDPTNRVSGVIMDVNTGEILAAAVMPDYDLNNPYEFSEYYQQIFDSFSATETEKKYNLRLLDDEWKKYKAEDMTESNFRSLLLNTMWNNKLVTEPYEPGSTFKIVTAAVALEEGAASFNDTFVCTSSGISVAGAPPIHCHKAGGHGQQTFAETLQNSCNPAFVTWGQKIGKEVFLKYFDAFGFTSLTGSDLLGERPSIYYKTTGSQFEALELAVYSFGQTFKTSVLQQLRAVSVVANGGNLVTPHIAKALTDNDGNIVKTYEFETVRQVISSDICEKIVQTLYEGTNKGTTKNAAVSGYSVAAKTGTSQKRDVKDEDVYISSSVAFAPAEDPQIAIIIMVDEPRGNDFYGGLVAAPVVSKVLTEVLPYLGVQKSSAETVESVAVADYRGAEIENAKTTIENLGLKYKVIGSGASVVDQMPRFGSTVLKGGTIVLYTDENAQESIVTVPNVVKSTPSAAISALNSKKLNINITGNYNTDITEMPLAISQTPAAGEAVPEGTVIQVEFRYEGIEG